VLVEAIPIVGEGVPVSPALADTDGDGRDEVAVAAFTGSPELYRGDGTRIGGPPAGGSLAGGHFATIGTGLGSRSTSPSVLALGANAAFGRTRSGGPLGFFGGMVDSRLVPAQLSPATRIGFEHVLGGWDAASGDWRAAFPIPTEGWHIAGAPAVADVDGDGNAEVLVGSSGNLLHAFKEDATEPRGWPKETGNWLLASPAVGDVDGDGLAEVVAITRAGHLFTWDTPARQSDRVEWPSFRHDARNTGRYGAPDKVGR
jgi:hypothetical protein